jgi:UDP-N-acetylmuramoyl-L-alanyl-D-glutamate--2,6-diaminopimelate ligase
VPVVSVPNLNSSVGALAARFYHYPATKLKMIGVTGTNGKTSCSYYVAQALQHINIRCGVVGTLGTGFIDALHPTGFTTPEPVLLQKQLAALLAEQAKVVVMEASSHGLLQNRLQAVPFETAIFTNLTRDHLDYHGTMENYARAKHRLFEGEQLKLAVLNLDDPYGRDLAEELKNQVEVIGYTATGQTLPGVQILSATRAEFSQRGFKATIATPWGEGVLKSALLGRFNLSNVLAVLAVLGHFGVDLKTAIGVVSILESPPGRMQRFVADEKRKGVGKYPLVIVDYAHTPDALQQALEMLREHCQGKLWCVFGCGGDRDRGKRALMGEIAERGSDQIILTDDNPRTEDPVAIVNDIISGLVCPWAIEVEHDRQAAIAHAIECAASNDIVLIAGKGNEAFQIIADQRIPFSDAEHVMAQLAR